MALQYSAMPLDHGGFVVTVIAETPAVFAALKGRLEGITPSAFIPDRVVPHDLAAALLRDCPPEDNTAPPVEDYGNPIAPIVLDDDEEPPLRACPTGGCGLD